MHLRAHWLWTTSLLFALLGVATQPAAAQCTPGWTYYLDPVGPERFVRGLATHGGLLYARGDWSNVAGSPANNVAAFNGTTWSGVGTGSWPYSGSPAGNTGLISFQGELYAPLGGGSASVGYEIGAIWGGSSWSSWPATDLFTNPTPPPLNINRCWRAAVHDDTLYAAGTFFHPNAGGTGDRRIIAAFDGTSWSRMDGGYGPDITATDRIESIVSYNGALYVAGLFSAVRDGEQFQGSTTPASNIARWSGGAWTSLPNGGLNGRVYTMAVYNGDLYVGGDFTATSTGGISLMRIAKFNGTAWSAVNGGMGNARPKSMAVADDGAGRALFIGATAGVATNLPSTSVDVSGLVRWNGSLYSSPGGGIGGGTGIYAMARYDSGTGEALYVGADSLNDPNDLSHFGRIARWGPVPMVDTDGDGIPDVWETNGIDGNCDGTIDLLPSVMQCNTMRKDLFVEVDAMGDLGMYQAAYDDLIAAFAAAPVANPDNSTGITLHLFIDEVNLAVSDFPNRFVEFSAFKKAHFGHPGDSQALKDAKARIFRYCVMGNTHSNGGSSGFGELHGDDFTVTLGDASWGANHGGSDIQASTFMHEMGHTMGLYHGGHQIDWLSDQKYNYKPNYYSIMNYSWQLATTRHGWALDYSRSVLPTLDESALIEANGIGAATNARAMYGPHPARFSAMNIPIDWNRSGGMAPIDAGPVAADINAVKTGQSSPGGILEGSEDWSRLKYNFRTSPNYADGASPETSEDMDSDMTSDLIALTNPVLCLCPADADCSGTLAVADIFFFLNAWFAGDANADFDGLNGLQVADIFAFLNAWFAGC